MDSSASKGAVLITTKNGRAGLSGKPTISLGSSYTIGIPNYPDLQSTYAQGNRGAYIDGNNGQLGSSSWGPRMDTLRVNGLPVPVHNQLKEFLKNSHTTDNNLSVSGFTDKSSYIVSYSFLKNDGIIPTTDYIRNSFFAKYNTKLSDKFSVSSSIIFIPIMTVLSTVTASNLRCGQFTERRSAGIRCLQPIRMVHSGSIVPQETIHIGCLTMLA